MRIRSPLLSLSLASFIAAPALADRRGYSVTSFTRLRVEGPVTLKIEVGGSPAGYAEGDRDAIDRIRVDNAGDQLLVSVDRSNWTGEQQHGVGKGVLHISTPSIEALSVIGAGDVTIDRVPGSRFTLVLTGAGRADVSGLAVDQLVVGINGAGTARLAGHASQARIRSQGEGEVDGSELSAQDSDTSLIGAGTIRLRSERTARNVLKGSGTIAIDGKPACTGTSEGSGQVLCGADSSQASSR